MRLPQRALLMTALLFALLAGGGSAGPGISTSTSRSTVTVGDTITYRVRVVAAESAEVVMQQPVARLGDFDVLGCRRVPPRNLGGGMTLWAEEYLLAAYAPGEGAVSPVTAAVIGHRGDTTFLVGDTARVTVTSVLGDGDEELRDIKGPATAPARRVWPVLALCAAAAGAAFLAALILRRRRGAALGAAALPAPAPHVAALGRLERLLEAGFLETGRLKEFYVELSEILRAYLSQRYLIPAPELTTAEVAKRMEYLGLPRDLRRETCDILMESDMVKFAKYRPDAEMAFRAAGRAKSLVRESAAVETAPESAAP